ncbi:MAG: L,D-transpeptidase [Streptosporangiaceae bacterium]
MFFIGTNFAIHGDIPIPLKPASHGCVRVPVDVANVLYQQIRISQGGGTPIYIRGHAPGTLTGGPRPPHDSQAVPAPKVTGSPAGIKVPGVLSLVSPR